MATRLPFRTVAHLFCWEGAFAIAYETWIGATYLSGLAGELGITVRELSWLAAAPWIGSMGQIAGVVIMEKIPSVRRYTIWVASGARALWGIPMAAAAWWWIRSRLGGAPFPVHEWFRLATIVACVSAILASSGGVSWNSWLRGWIPAHIRGRFLGFRQRFTVAALIIAHLVAAFWVSWKPGGAYAGYALLASMGLVCAALSTFLLSRIPDAPDSLPAANAAPTRTTSLLERFHEPFRDVQFRNVLIFGTGFNGIFQLAAPYFNYYYTKEMGFPMSTVAAWMLLSNGGSLLAAGYWGRRIDRTGNPLTILLLTATCMSLSPLPYLVRSPATLAWIAPFEYVSNGFVSSGFQLAWATILFRTVPAGRNVTYFSVYTACVGIASAGCGMLGGELATWLAPYGGLRALWIVGAASRLSMLGLCFPLIAKGHFPSFDTFRALKSRKALGSSV